MRHLPGLLIFAAGLALGLLTMRLWMTPEPAPFDLPSGGALPTGGARGAADPGADGLGAGGLGAGGSDSAGSATRSMPASEPAGGAAGSAGLEGATPSEEIFARALATLEPPDLGHRSGSITGQVTTPDESPVPGVEITATPTRAASQDTANLSLAGRVARYAQDENWRETLRAVAVTDSDGRYRLESISDFEYQLSAKLSGYQMRASGSTHGLRPGSVVDFTATAMAQLEIFIRRPDGSEPEQAQVRIEAANRHSRVTFRSGNTRILPRSGGQRWRPEARVLQVQTGLLVVSASVGDNERSAQVEVQAVAGTAPLPVQLELRSRGAIRGTLRMPPGEVTSHVAIYLLAAALKPDPTVDDLRSAGTQTHVARGEPFVFADLDPGSYYIGAQRSLASDSQSVEMLLVEVADSTVEVTLDLAPILPEQGILAYVYDPHGALLPEVEFQVGIVRQGNSNWGSQGSIRQRDGGHLLLASEPQGARGGGKAEYLVSVYHTAYGELQQAVPSLQGAHIEFRYQLPAHLDFTLLGYAGSNVVGRIQVLVIPAGNDGGHHSVGAQVFDSTGTVRLGPYAPGAHVLRIVYQDTRENHWFTSPIHEETVTLQAGENRLSRPLPPLYSVTIVVPQAAGSAHVNLVRIGHEDAFGGRHEELDATGRITLEGLVEGRYRLRVWGEDTPPGSMDIEVPAPGPIVFDPPPVNAIRVDIHDPEGALAHMGFQNGDFIVRINGQSFSGHEELALLGTFLQGARAVPVTVLRGTQEIDLTLEPGKLRGDPGGSLEPASR